MATTIVITSQPGPPVSTQGATQVIHKLHTGAKLSTGSRVGTGFAIAQLMPTREATRVGTGFAWGKPKAATTEATRNQV